MAWSNENNEYEVLSLNSGFSRTDIPCSQYRYRARRSPTILAAFEALVGLLIEVTFIATLTRRLFGK